MPFSSKPQKQHISTFQRSTSQCYSIAQQNQDYKQQLSCILVKQHHDQIYLELQNLWQEQSLDSQDHVLNCFLRIKTLGNFLQVLYIVNQQQSRFLHFQEKILVLLNRLQLHFCNLTKQCKPFLVLYMLSHVCDNCQLL